MPAGKALLHGYNGSPMYIGQLPKAKPCCCGLQSCRDGESPSWRRMGTVGVVSMGLWGAVVVHSYRGLPCLRRLANAMVVAGVVCGWCHTGVLAVGGVSGECYKRSVLEAHAISEMARLERSMTVGVRI